MEQEGDDRISGRILNLQNNTDFFLTVFKGLVGYAVIAADFDGNIIAFNDGAKNIYGYETGDVVGRKKVESFFARAFIEKTGLQRMIAGLIEQGSISFEADKVRKNGERFPAKCLFTLTKGNDGRIVGFVEIDEDMTALRRAQEDLRALNAELEQKVVERTLLLEASEERFRAVVESASDAVVCLEPPGNIYLWNSKAEAMFGYTPAESIGKHLHEMIVPEKYRKAATEGLRSFSETGKGNIVGKTVEVTGLKKDGTEFPVEVSVAAVNLHGIWNSIGIIRDITVRKRIEEEKALLEMQVRHLQKMEAIGRLTGGIAHDFNNLLTAIIGNATLIKMNSANDNKVKHFVEQLLATSEMAANLTRGLLIFSRIQIVDIKPVDLNQAIMGVRSILQRLIGENIELDITLSGEPLTIKADAGQIDMALVNLATNARDAMPDVGCFSISTKVIHLDNEFAKKYGYGKTGRYALITVSDTGMGMDKATMEKIFEPFFSTKEVGKGTGLGLSIVYGIIKQHDGYINVYSEPGEGTTFKIYLPLIETSAQVEEAKNGYIPKRGTETILLAEDESSVRQFVKILLEEFGYSVIEAVDGEDAIAKFKANKEKIKLVVLDVIMPRRNGKDVYDSVLAVKPKMKVLFTSGYSEEIISKKRILEDGLNFVSKPFIPTELLRCVRAVLDDDLKNMPVQKSKN